MFESKLKQIILDLAMKKVDGDQINETTSLTNDLGYDSILFVELIVNLEIEFGISFDDEDMDLDLFLNFGNLSEYVRNKVEHLNATEQSV